MGRWLVIIPLVTNVPLTLALYIARLWYNILHSRFFNHYGQEHPRLDRNQSILGEFVTEDHRVFRIAKYLCLGLPETHHARLNGIYIDNMVDRRDFHTFVADCLDDWKTSISWVRELL